MQEIINFLFDLGKCLLVLIGNIVLLIILCGFIWWFVDFFKKSINTQRKSIQQKDDCRPIPPDGGSADD